MIWIFISGLLIGAILGHRFLPSRVDRRAEIQHGAAMEIMDQLAIASLTGEKRITLDQSLALRLCGVDPEKDWPEISRGLGE